MVVYETDFFFDPLLKGGETTADTLPPVCV